MAAVARRESTTIGVAMGPDEAVARAGQALQVIGAKSIGMIAPGVVVGSMGVSFLSWGETIHLTVTPAEAGSWITIHSESSVSFTLIDWGKNAGNIRQLAGILTQWDHQLHPR